MPRHFPVSGEISGLHVSAFPTTLGNCSIANTTFHNNSNTTPRHPNDRLMIRDVSVNRCEHFACSARGVIFDSVSVTDIRGGALTARSFLWGCAYHHTTLRGWIAGIMFRWMISPDDEIVSLKFQLANTKLHESFDWALDITEASFSFYQELLGVPAVKIRRDPERHFIMTNVAAREIVRNIGRTVWVLSAESLIESGLPDTVIVTGGAGKKLRAELEELNAYATKGCLYEDEVRIGVESGGTGQSVGNRPVVLRPREFAIRKQPFICEIRQSPESRNLRFKVDRDECDHPTCRTARPTSIKTPSRDSERQSSERDR
jgi:hypothetical protein